MASVQDQPLLFGLEQHPAWVFRVKLPGPRRIRYFIEHLYNVVVALLEQFRLDTCNLLVQLSTPYIMMVYHILSKRH